MDEAMNEELSRDAERACSPLQKLWIYPVTILVVTAIALPIAAGFYTPSGPRARVMLPGVVIAVATALISCILFLCCPSRPLRVKLVTLLLAIPSMLFAVYCVMEHISLNSLSASTMPLARAASFNQSDAGN